MNLKQRIIFFIGLSSLLVGTVLYGAGIQGSVSVPARGTRSVNVSKVNQIAFSCASTMRVSFDNNTTSGYMEYKSGVLDTSSASGRNSVFTFGRISTISKASKTCRYRGI